MTIRVFPRPIERRTVPGVVLVADRNISMIGRSFGCVLTGIPPLSSRSLAEQNRA